jgi:hypothetical protein
MVSMWSGCDEQEGVCYGSPASAPDAADSRDACSTAKPPIVCADAGADPLAGADDVYDGDRYNNGVGPLLDPDPPARASDRDACMSQAKTKKTACVANAKKDAEIVCSSDARTGQGIFPDGTPVEPGEEKACEHAYVYGTDEKSVTQGSDATQVQGGADTSTQGRELGASGPFLGVTLSGKSTNEEQHQRNWSRSTGENHSETTNHAGRKGWVDQCIEQFEAERNRCIRL